MNILRSAGLPLLLLLAACGTTIESRIRKQQTQFDSYPPEVQTRIKAGEVDVGFTADMVRMAMGKPARKSMRATQASTQEVWSYEYPGTRSSVGLSFGTGSWGPAYGGGVAVGGGGGPYGDWATVVFEGGKVVAVEKIKK